MKETFEYKQGEFDGKVQMLSFLHDIIVRGENPVEKDLGDERLNEIRDRVLVWQRNLTIADEETRRYRDEIKGHRKAAEGYQKTIRTISAERSELRKLVETQRAEAAVLERKLGRLSEELGKLNDKLKPAGAADLRNAAGAAPATPFTRAGDAAGISQVQRRAPKGDDS